MLAMKQLLKSHKFDQKRDNLHLSQSRSAKDLPTRASMTLEDYGTAIRNKQWQRLLPKSTAIWRAPRIHEEGGLGTEGWLGLMIFLGVVLGLLYARAVLP
jgi:hypothetical protein